MKSINLNIDPAYEFKNELACIKNPAYYELAIEALHKAPDYFWTVPASASGKYHPKSSLGTGGLVRHVKSVFWISEELLPHPLYAPFTDDEKDAIRVAILLHDACKQGTSDVGTTTVTEHPLLVRDHLEPTFILDRDMDSSQTYAWDLICNLIETHMGIWTKDPKTKVEVLKVPETKMQLFVHMCDYLASRKNIEIDYQSRDAQQNYASKSGDSEPSWKKELATEGQITYIRKLYMMAKEKGLRLPPLEITDSTGKQTLTKGKASEIIEKLKQKLGL